MEFDFDAQNLLAPAYSGVAVLHGRRLSGYSSMATASRSGRLARLQHQPRGSLISQIAAIVDQMGQASSVAQKLPQTITTMGRFSGTEQRLYLKVSGNVVQGLLKVGERTIFYRDYAGKCKELIPLCVLDFYVHESMQRQGIGLEIFQYMLDTESIKPNKIAYDKPSSKLIKFLDKHYGLKSFIPQNNNYVIYESFWNLGYSVPKNTIEKLRGYQNSQKCIKDQIFEDQRERDEIERENLTQKDIHYFKEAEQYQNKPNDLMKIFEEDQWKIEEKLRQEEEEIKRSYQQDMSRNHKKMQGHNSNWNPNKRKSINAPSNTNYGDRRTNKPDNNHAAFSEPTGLQGIPHYGNRFNKHQGQTTTNRVVDETPTAYNLTPVMLPEPHAGSMPQKRNVTAYEREMVSLE
jgi:alpha-tubulin N-acetyltransferase 1